MKEALEGKGAARLCASSFRGEKGSEALRLKTVPSKGMEAARQ